MRSILDRAAISVAAQPAEAAPVSEPRAKYVPKAPVKHAEIKHVVPEQSSAFDEPAEEAAPAVAEEAPAPKAQKATGKSRVGSMFDLLTFSDV